MMVADLPDEEEMRLLELNSYDVLGNESEEDFNDLATLAVQIFNYPIALVSLIDNNHQWFKGKSGTNETGNSRDLSFCAHTILQDNVMVVEDATKDKRFFDNPVVAGDFNIRFYAGAPILSPAGYKLGTVCLFDVKPGILSEADKKSLILLAKQASKLLELRKKNLVIRQRAEDIIELKSTIIGQMMQVQIDDKISMAHTLHEDLAQRIASGLLCLRTAENSSSSRPDLIHNAAKQLEEVLAGIKSLTYSIVPQAINVLPADVLIKEYIEKVAPAFDFSITINTESIAENNYSNIAVHAIGIIGQWLKVLAQKSITNVHIAVNIEDRFEILFEDNAAAAEPEKRKQEVLESSIYDRVKSMHGSTELFSLNGRQVLKISLPLVE
ncbi:GAF domain-containing protein [Ferruginibacter paludis]|uniref:GAF domain-containing protein n=1 Tax=Ferruginibacter paludis TaxID=1310417 RepID=UPI0025B32308|nr:GAF domain-containing protein [Ferruginibacter paludis]MDN3656883.1 GAF domain-containing protein [Ferruginibacter paludis]